MTGLVSDTHAAIWFLAGLPGLSAAAKDAMNAALGSGGAIVLSTMPDRIIAATALLVNLPLVSRDRKIRASALRPIW